MGIKGHPGPGHKPLQYPPEIWVTLRTLYESGQFATLRHVYDHLKRMQPGLKLPSFQYVKQKAANEGWNKHSSDAEIAERKTQSIAEMFEEFQMPLKERVRRNVLGVVSVDKTLQEINSLLITTRMKVDAIKANKPDVAIEGTCPYCGSSPQPDSSSSAIGETLNALESLMDNLPRMAQGLKISLEYLKNSHTLCGDNAPEKKHLMGDALKKPARDLDDLTPEEMDKEVERLLRNRKG